MPEVNYTYKAKLDRIIDGDTVVLIIDNGFYNRELHSIRLKGVDTPEIFTSDKEEKERGYLAKSQVEAWFKNTHNCTDDEPIEWSLILVTEKNKRSFNRYIGDIYCVRCGNWLNDFLRKLGYGEE